MVGLDLARYLLEVGGVGGWYTRRCECGLVGGGITPQWLKINSPLTPKRQGGMEKDIHGIVTGGVRSSHLKWDR